MYIALLLSTISLCYIICELSKVTRENLELVVSDLGHIQIKINNANDEADRPYSKESSE